VTSLLAVLLLGPLAFPFGRVAAGALPVLQVAVLVRHAEVSAGEPPPKGSTEAGALTPAVRVATALALAWVVHPAQHRRHHDLTVRPARPTACPAGRPPLSARGMPGREARPAESLSQRRLVPWRYMAGVMRDGTTRLERLPGGIGKGRLVQRQRRNSERRQSTTLWHRRLPRRGLVLSVIGRWQRPSGGLAMTRGLYLHRIRCPEK
jgi:hypothetical protein